MRDLWLVSCNTDYGVYLHFDSEVDRELKNEISAFLRWIRKNYKFPVKLNIRISSEYRYEKNLQGDIVGIMNEDGYKVVSYSYDVWGVP